MAKRSKRNTAIDAVIKQTLEKQIGEQVWDILKEHIEEDVYKAYTPEGRWVFGTPQDSLYDGYQRRRTTGLLNESDKSITVSNVGNTWTLHVTTNAQPTPSVLGDSWDAKPGGFLSLLESGNLGFWSWMNDRVPDPFPRPVIRNAQEEASANMKKYSNELASIVKEAMSKQL